jgi:hypothetical protein
MGKRGVGVVVRGARKAGEKQEVRGSTLRGALATPGKASAQNGGSPDCASNDSDDDAKLFFSYSMLFIVQLQLNT